MAIYLWILLVLVLITTTKFIIIRYIPFAGYTNLEIAIWSYIVSLHKFKKGEYNCQNFSSALKKKLKDYNVVFVGGYTDERKYVICEVSKSNICCINHNEKLSLRNMEPHEWIYLVDKDLHIDPQIGAIINKKNIVKSDKIICHISIPIGISSLGFIN